MDNFFLGIPFRKAKSDGVRMSRIAKCNRKNCNTVSAYAQTLEKTVKDPEQTRRLYDQLSFIIIKLNKERL